MSKAAKKNKKRAEKRAEARLKNKLAEDVENIVELKDPISILRDQLQEAKSNKVKYSVLSSTGYAFLDKM